MSTARPANAAGRRRSLFVAGVCYLVFVVYGSLVPLDYRPFPLDAAWGVFLHTSYLALGVGSRADWVANILLYIPLAYLFSASIAASARSTAARVFLIAIIFAACAAIAVGVEFTQLFFPPRTVSLNDILAELIGSALGIVFWLVWGDALEGLWNEMERGGVPAIRAAVVGYVLAYAAFSLFPYDFLVSAQEYAEKFASGNGYALLAARQTCERASSCAGKFIAEVVAVVPLGVLLGMAISGNTRRIYRIAALCGLALGLVIELTQLFLASGVSEGISLVTRAIGVTFGVALHRHARLHKLAALRPYLAVALLVAAPLYLLALMWANAWFLDRWGSSRQARAVLDTVHWLPFYYHYYTTETHAMRSLIATIAMYLPVGFGFWLFKFRFSPKRIDGSALIPALLAAPLAAVMEAGKLFVPGKHPDPTDVPIAMFAAAAGFRIAQLIYHWALQGEPESLSADTRHSDTKPSGSALRSVGSLLLLIATAVAVFNYPLGGGWLALALTIYAAFIWLFPQLTLAAVLALLPWLNLSQWSGWIAITEFDLLIALTIAVRLARPSEPAVESALSPGTKWAIVMLSVSFLVSAIVGLLPLSPLDANALGTYYASFNSLRQLKGYAWALALLPLLIEEARHAERMTTHWTMGMLVGLCGVVSVILWERAAFVGLANFSSEYRAEGPFPELHTGGGDVHAYLAAAMPFVVAWLVVRPSLVRVAVGIVIFGLATYALGVTFTRGGYVGYAGVVVVVGIGALLHALRQRARRPLTLALAAVPLAAALAIMIPMLSSGYMESRIAGSQREASTRSSHWSKAIEMMDGGVASAVFGMGLGTFPRTFLFRNHEAASATYSFERENGNGFVRLGSGRPLFLGQRVPIEPGADYVLALDVRSANPKAKVDLSLCERSFQQSFRCKWETVAVSEANRWEHKEVTSKVDEVGSGRWPLRRPVVFSLSNSQAASIVDVDNVQLRDGTGKNLLANGDFSQGAAHWFFSADDHLPWHVFNLWVQVFFEQGWFGVLACAVALTVLLNRLIRATWRGDIFAAALLASLVGFLLIGLTESLFDSPRITTLFFLVLFAGFAHRPQRPPIIGAS